MRLRGAFSENAVIIFFENPAEIIRAEREVRELFFRSSDCGDTVLEILYHKWNKVYISFRRKYKQNTTIQNCVLHGGNIRGIMI